MSTSNELDELVAAWVGAVAMKKEASRAVKARGDDVKDAAANLMTKMRELGITEVPLDNGRRITVVETLRDARP